MSRAAQLAVLLVGMSVVGLGCVQRGGLVTASTPEQRAPHMVEDTIRLSQQEMSHGSSTRLPDSLRARTKGTPDALEAARVDPGILLYAEPPPGTRMPIHMPPENMDSEMIWPVDPSLEPPKNLDLEEVQPADP